jgi:DNA mismatch repair ATPase MutS
LISDSLAQRYAELKREAPGCVLLMQVGAFMKVLDDDARSVDPIKKRVLARRPGQVCRKGGEAARGGEA